MSCTYNRSTGDLTRARLSKSACMAGGSTATPSSALHGAAEASERLSQKSSQQLPRTRSCTCACLSKPGCTAGGSAATPSSALHGAAEASEGLSQ
eukprot:1161114-Pelagomonas_calceolata.AAC.9